MESEKDSRFYGVGKDADGKLRRSFVYDLEETVDDGDERNLHRFRASEIRCEACGVSRGRKISSA
ncbi:hypothetical protein D3C87_1412910 [compost metagenome]